MINLPRQARDKHSEKNSKTDDVFSCGQGEVYRPTFIYHGFRYVRLDNFPGTPEEARKVRKRLLCALPFIALKNTNVFAKTGSGQTQEKHSKKRRFVSAQAVVGLFMHSDVTPHGNLTISQSTSEGQILGAVHAAVVQTQACNIYSIPTDCPQREKRGWMGMKTTASLCFPTFYSTRYSPYYTLYIVIVLPTQARDKSIYHCSSNHNYH